MNENLQTLSVLVENKPGVLARVAALFARRGYNITSLAVGPTETDAYSRITVGVDVQQHTLDQIINQLDKLINVITIQQLVPATNVQRELILVKVNATVETRSNILEIVEMFRARIIDVSPESLAIEATGGRDKLDAMLTMLEPFGVRELVKSGTVAIGRGPQSLADLADEQQHQLDQAS